MFEGYLELGGGEVLNNARSRGYTKSADCPASWLICPPCDGLQEALGDEPYTYANIDEAPWYDYEDEVTHRFLGAYGLKFEGLPDSTREANVAEAILDGGVVGRVRHNTRRIRVEAVLTAVGEDALETGFAWLNSVLTPGKCGTHGDACGAADASFFAACPPELNGYHTAQPVWNDPVTNLAINPSFEGPDIPAGGTKSTEWSSAGTSSLHIPAGPAVAVATLDIQTFLITPRTAGQTVWLAGAPHVATGDGVPIRVYGTGAVTLGEGWWDQMLIVAGDYLGPYFDGSIPDSSEQELDTIGARVHEFEWDGTPDASTSTGRTGTIIGAEDPLAWGEAVQRLIRNLHTVTCVAGPTVINKIHRQNTWGYHVEFVLVAAVPFIFSETVPIESGPTYPIVVQDVPFNLVPYPSAELALGSVIAATNFATNPSVETGITGWAKVSSAVAAADVVVAQSTELASAGTKSAKANYTATTSGTGGFFGAGQTVALPGITPTTRYSVNLWASASKQSGAAVLGDLEYHAYWQDAGGATLRDDKLATSAAAGGVVSVKSILPPAGTTQVLVRAFQRLTSWSSGDIVRLYVDALAVTMP